MRIFLFVLLVLQSFLNINGQQVYELYEDGQLTLPAVADDSASGNRLPAKVRAYLPPYYLKTRTAIVLAPAVANGAEVPDSTKRVDLIEWLNQIGVIVFELTYPPGIEQPVSNPPVSTAMANLDKTRQRVRLNALDLLSWVKKNAPDFGIDPEKVGWLSWQSSNVEGLPMLQDASGTFQPNFVALIQPGFEFAPAMKHLNKQGATLFLAHCPGESTEAPEDLMLIYQNWQRTGRLAELHLYQHESLGFGTATFPLPDDPWRQQFSAWLRAQGLLQKQFPNKYEKLYGEESVARGQQDRIERMTNDYAQLNQYKSENAALEIPGQDEGRIVLLGNSITAAWPGADGAFFADHRLLNRGISGQTSDQMLLRFRADVIELRPSAVVIHLGTNDVAENTGPYDPDRTLGNLRSMTDLAKANDISVILAAVLPATKFEWNRKLGDRSDMIVALNEMLRSYAERENIPFVDYHSALKNQRHGMDPDLAADGVHPTKKGYEVMKSLLLPVLLELKGNKE